MILGTDAGTSLVKAAAFDGSGENLGVAAKRTTLLYRGDGRVEQDFDEAGRAVRPAISWLDARGGSLVEGWMKSGVFEDVFRRNANAVFPGSQASLLDVLAREEPASLERATTAGYCKYGIFQRLTGERLTDASEASLPFLDVTNGAGLRR